MQLPLTDVWIHEPTLHLSDAGRWFLLAFLTVLGAIFGSFMNVVVYRLPRGMNLSYPGSRCPTCGHPIRWYDNVPIVGWLKLGGRCRDCGAPISSRYPIVEALTAAISGLIAWTEGMPEVVFPVPEPGTYEARLDLYAFHFLLVATLVCAALMEFDGQLLPAKMWISVLVVGLVATCFQPGLHSPGSVIGMPNGEIGSASLDAFVNGLAGLVAALAISVVPWAAWFSRAKTSRLAGATSSAAGLVLVGTFLGAEAVLAIGTASMALYLVTRLFAHVWPAAARIGWAGGLTVITLIWIVVGSQAERFDEIIAGYEWICAIAGGLLIALLAIAVRLLPRADLPVQKS